MNNETTLPGVEAASEEWTLEPIQETEAVVVVDATAQYVTDLIHADLFGSFLICGTLIGLSLLRGIHGS